METRLKSLEKKVDKILFYLESDDNTKQKGLVEKVGSIDKELQQLLVREREYKAKASVWGVVGGFVSAALFYVAKLIMQNGGK